SATAGSTRHWRKWRREVSWAGDRRRLSPAAAGETARSAACSRSKQRFGATTQSTAISAIEKSAACCTQLVDRQIHRTQNFPFFRSQERAIFIRHGPLLETGNDFAEGVGIGDAKEIDKALKT